MNVCVIPARGGSTRIPGKNIREFHGKPIIAYSIETARASCLFDQGIYVSTDSKDIADVAEECGAFVLHRPPRMAKNEIGTQEVMRWHLNNELMMPGLVNACCVYATSPLLFVEDLRYGFDVLSDGATYAFSVNSEPLFDAGQFYWGKAKAFRTNAPLVSVTSRMVPIPADRVCDINTKSDWKRAERMYAALHFEIIDTDYSETLAHEMEYGRTN